MEKDEIEQQISFDPRRYTPKVQALIIAKSEEWGCPPSETVARLLDGLAEKINDPAPNDEN